MTTTTKGLIAFGVVAGVFGLLAFFGATPFLSQITNTKVEQLAGSAVGTTASTQHLAQVVVAPINASATTTSLLNTDSSDRIVSDAYVDCTGLTTILNPYTGAGIAVFTLIAATTSTSAPAAGAQASNAIFNTTIATGTNESFVSSSTLPVASSWLKRWNAGSYMTFTYNATSSALNCVEGVRYFQS